MKPGNAKFDVKAPLAKVNETKLVKGYQLPVASNVRKTLSENEKYKSQRR